MVISIHSNIKRAYYNQNSPDEIDEYSSINFRKKIWINEDNKLIKDSTRGLVTIYNDLGNVQEEYVLENKKAYRTFKYYYRTEGKVLAVKLENKNQRLVIDFNYKLDTTATIADLISFDSKTTLIDINKINISNIYVSKTNNKQLIIDFDRELKIGDSFSLEATQDLPLSDGRFVALSIKNDQIGTAIIEDSATERTTISQNKNEVCIHNAEGLERVELLSTTGVTLANTIAAGTNEVKIMLGNYEQGMYILRVKETSGNLSTFKIVK
ncbi:MAG: hypothetical protein IPO21_10775 [Bacteroidales bacterium]|nr:hypothetical protein [Bacteroidales bacterium]